MAKKRGPLTEGSQKGCVKDFSSNQRPIAPLPPIKPKKKKPEVRFRVIPAYWIIHCSACRFTNDVGKTCIYDGTSREIIVSSGFPEWCPLEKPER